MDFKLEMPTRLGYFASLVESDAHFPLLEAAASLAQDQDATLDIQSVLDEVDQLVNRLKQRLPSDAGALHKLRLLNKFFFEELGFAGNVNDYGAVGNSYLSVVLQTRLGIPISLAVLWLELAVSLQLDAVGVGFPGSFLVKVRLPYPHEGHVVIDPMNGDSLSREDLLERLTPFHAESGLLGQAEMVPDELLMFYLRSATPREIVARMLRNLELLHTQDSNEVQLALVRQRLGVLLPRTDEPFED